MNPNLRKTLTVLITIGMLLSILHTAISFAEEPIKIQVGNSSALEDAIVAANIAGTAIIEVTNDIILTNNIDITSDITIISTAGDHTITIASGCSIKVQNGNLILGDGTNTNLLTLLSTSKTIHVVSGTVHIKKGGTVSATGTNSIAIYADNGDVLVSGGTVSATGSYCSAIETNTGNVIVSGGTVIADGNGLHGCYAIYLYNPGTVTITGGSVSVVNSVANMLAITLAGGGLAAYLKDTCTGTHSVSGSGIIVEVDSIEIPSAYSGTTNGLTRKEGGVLTNVKWDLSGTNPVISFNNGQYTIEWTAPDTTPPITPASEKVRLQETGELFNTLTEAITAAGTKGLSVFTLEILGDLSETNSITITSTITIVGAEGTHTVTTSGITRVTNGGSLTLGDGTNTNPLTILGDVEVAEGTINVKDGIILKNNGKYALFLNGPKAYGTISGGRLEGNEAVLNLENGAQLSEISGGLFIGKQVAVHLSDAGTRIDKISGGVFYQTNNDLNFDGHCFLLNNNAAIGEISGGYFEANRDCAMYIINGGWVDEISGGNFIATRKGEYREPALGPDYWNSVIRIEAVSNIKTGIGTISDGFFYGGANGAYFGILLINRSYYANGPQIDLICGGDIRGIVALQPDVGSYIGEIKGGKISGSSTGILSVGKIGKIGGDVTITTTASNPALWNYNAYASIDEIYGGTISALSTDVGSGITNNGVITKISGGTISSAGVMSNAIRNNYIIGEISGGTITAPAQLGNGITNAGTINKITGGTILAIEPFDRGSNGITNSGTIDEISGGTIIGDNNAISNTGKLNVITNGVFWGKNGVAITLAYPLTLEPGLNANKGLGHYQSGNGYDIFTNEDLVTYPQDSKGDYYFMSTLTEPVAGIANVEFKFLTLNGKYDIIYLLNGGVNAPSNPSLYSASKLPCSIDVPTRPGYTFVGWTVVYSNGQPSVAVPTVAYSIPVGTSGTVTLTAHWLKNDLAIEYMVTYNGNGNTGGNVPVDVNSPYGSGSLVTVLGKSSLVREGYTFLGWADSSEATIAVYVAGSTFNIFSDTVLYAVWQKLPVYTVTFKPGLHGSFADYASETELVYVVVSGAATPQAPKLAGEAGWVFAGWSPVVAPTVTQDVVYVAQWSPIVYTVTYAPGTQGTFAAQVYAGLVYGTVTPAFTGTPFGTSGYTFAGWTPTITTTVTADVTYTAQWTPNNTPNNNGGGGSSQPKPPAAPKPPAVTPLPPSVTPPATPTPPVIDDDNSLPTWALVNLILSIAGLIIAIIVIICVLLQRKQKQKNPEQRQAQTQNAKGKSVAKQNQKDMQTEEEEMKKKKQRRLFWFLLSVIMGIAGIIVFILTEDMTRPMAMVDKWTVVNLIIFIIEIIAVALIFKRKKNSDNDDEAYDNEAPLINNKDKYQQ